jgi:hypothetical protein
LANDTVLIVGGGVRTGDGPAPTAEALKTSDVVNPQADGGVAADAAPGPSPRSARRGGSLIRLPGANNDGPWLLAGGAGEADRPMELLRDGVFVAPADGGWGAYDAASAPNLFAPAVVDLGDGEHVVVAGGAVAAPLAFERRWELQWRDRTEVLVVSAADGAIVDTAGDNAPRLYLGGSGLLEGGALLTGGIVVSTGGDATIVPVVTDSTLRVAVSGATSPGPRLAQARAGHASATMADGTVVVAGGLTLPTADRLATLRDSVELLNAGDAP